MVGQYPAFSWRDGWGAEVRLRTPVLGPFLLRATRGVHGQMCRTSLHELSATASMIHGRKWRLVQSAPNDSVFPAGLKNTSGTCPDVIARCCCLDWRWRPAQACGRPRASQTDIARRGSHPSSDELGW